MHLLQQQLQAGAGNIAHSLNPSLQGLSTLVGASSTRLDGQLAGQSGTLPSVGSIPVQGGGNVDSDQVKSLLPAYRQAPDYNTAVQIKYGAVVVGDSSSGEALYENQRKVSIDVREKANFIIESRKVYEIFFLNWLLFGCSKRNRYTRMKLCHKFTHWSCGIPS